MTRLIWIFTITVNVMSSLNVVIKVSNMLCQILLSEKVNPKTLSLQQDKHIALILTDLCNLVNFSVDHDDTINATYGTIAFMTINALILSQDNIERGISLAQSCKFDKLWSGILFNMDFDNDNDIIDHNEKNIKLQIW